MSQEEVEFLHAAPDEVDVTPEIDEIAEIRRSMVPESKRPVDDAWKIGYPYDKKISTIV